MVVSSSEGVRWRTAACLKLTRSLKGGRTDTPRAGLAMATFCLVPLRSFCQVTWEILTGGLLLMKMQRSSTCEPTNPDLLESIWTICPSPPKRYKGKKKIQLSFWEQCNSLHTPVHSKSIQQKRARWASTPEAMCVLPELPKHHCVWLYIIFI